MKNAPMLVLSATLFAAGCQSDEKGGESHRETAAKPEMEKPVKPPANSNRPMKNQPPPASDGAYIGMDLKAAETQAEKSGLRHRVVERDGKPLPATRDYRPNRVNFSVKAGKVIKVTRG
ncbi:MAG: hypothetical protein MI807_18020 [Verrucomicrobiales bacterium]|nr:hypothetical protein [Verrucomicrobiales bacterium]